MSIILVNLMFQNDEFAVYNPSQQCIRYLVEYSMPDDIKIDHVALTDIVQDIQMTDELRKDVAKIGTLFS